jgi:16S rRNA G966 N2-methylase RsmD
MKPVELAIKAISHSSLPGDGVLDLFGGSGTALIAAEQTGRRSFLMELAPLYCDVIVNRWEQFTGKKAERVIVKDAAVGKDSCLASEAGKEVFTSDSCAGVTETDPALVAGSAAEGL